jgi:MFS family permease
MLLGGVGMSATMAPVTSTAMASVPRDKAGVGSAVLNSMRQVGGSLGIAVMGAIVAASVTESSGKVGLHADPAAFLRGFHHALEVGVLIALVGAAIGVATLRKVHHPEPHPQSEAQHGAVLVEV